MKKRNARKRTVNSATLEFSVRNSNKINVTWTANVTTNMEKEKGPTPRK